MATTLATLRQRTLESTGDYISVIVTTAIAASTSVISTNLKEYDGGADDYFNDWYCYITDKANIGVERQVSDYTSSTGALIVRGSALSTDGANLATIWVCRHSVLQKIDKAINRTIEEVFPALHRRIDDLSLISGNILPDASFDWWTSSTALNFISTSNATLAQTTTAGLYRGQLSSNSMKVTASAANGYAFYDSNTYPKLLDLMGRTVDFKCWAYPEVADDAFLTIYTLKADGTAQTLNSTTTCPAAAWTLLELEDQTLNDDLVRVQFRFRVLTNAKYVYFDDALVCGKNLYEYLVPYALQKGYVNQLYLQTEGYSDDPCYDINPREWEQQDFAAVDDGTYKYLTLVDLPSSFYRMRAIGVAPMSSLSTATGTINIDEGGRTDLLVAYAGYLLYEMAESPISSEDYSRYEREKAKRYAKYLGLLRKYRMITPSSRLKGI